MSAILSNFVNTDQTFLTAFERGDPNTIREVIVSHARALADFVEGSEQHSARDMCEVTLGARHILTRGTMVLREMVKASTVHA